MIVAGGGVTFADLMTLSICVGQCFVDFRDSISARQPPRHPARENAKTEGAAGAVFQISAVRARCVRNQDVDQREVQVSARRECLQGPHQLAGQTAETPGIHW